MKKLAIWLAMLPLAALADMVSDWYEYEYVPLLDRPSAQFWIVSSIAFVALIGLTVLIGRRKRWQLIPIVVPEAVACFLLLFLAWFLSDGSSTAFFHRTTIHHRWEGPNSNYGVCPECRDRVYLPTHHCEKPHYEDAEGGCRNEY